MTTAGREDVYPTPPYDRHWWSPFLVFGEITVAQVDLSADAAREELALGWLDAAERARRERYLPEPRRRFVLCRAALRQILCHELGFRNRQLSFLEGDYGKPYAVVEGRPASVSFSVSHSEQHGLIAFARAGRLGVDVEEIVPKRHLISLIEAVMGPDERSELGELEGWAKLRQFFRLWTCKEALVKALGTGFSTNISSFQVPANIRRGETSGVFRFPHLPTVAWRLEDIGREGFAAALASEMPSAGSYPIGRDGGHSEVSPAKV